MNTPLIAAAAALVALGLASTAEAAMSVGKPAAPSLVAKAGCWDECEEYLEAVQEAREEAREAAQEAAEAYAEDAEDYGNRPRRMQRQEEPASRREALAPAQPQPPPAKPDADKQSSKEDDKQPAPKSADGKSKIASNVKGSCKQYFPAVGMTLSVPCE